MWVYCCSIVGHVWDCTPLVTCYNDQTTTVSFGFGELIQQSIVTQYVGMAAGGTPGTEQCTVPYSTPIPAALLVTDYNTVTLLHI